MQQLCQKLRSSQPPLEWKLSSLHVMCQTRTLTHTHLHIHKLIYVHMHTYTHTPFHVSGPDAPCSYTSTPQCTHTMHTHNAHHIAHTRTQCIHTMHTHNAHTHNAHTRAYAHRHTHTHMHIHTLSHMSGPDAPGSYTSRLLASKAIQSHRFSTSPRGSPAPTHRRVSV